MNDSPDLSALLNLPASTLREMAEELREGSLRHGISIGLLTPFVGSMASSIAAVFNDLCNDGCTTNALAGFCTAMHVSKSRIEKIENDVYLTLSGPDVPGIPVVDTGTVVRSLFEEAKHEVIVSSYVFSHAKELLAPLAARMKADSDFKVRFVLDLTHQRKPPDEALPIVANRFKKHFLEHHWTGSTIPEFWHDPRNFHETEQDKRGVMHSKVVIIDNSAALVTSANFTAAAHMRNIEAGVLIRHARQVRMIKDYFEALISTKQLVLIQ